MIEARLSQPYVLTGVTGDSEGNPVDADQLLLVKDGDIRLTTVGAILPRSQLAFLAQGPAAVEAVLTRLNAIEARLALLDSEPGA